MKEILVYRFDEIIYAPIDIVFSYVDDDEKIKCWNTLFIENIYETEEDKHAYKPGTQFKTVQKIGKKTYTIDTSIVEYKPPHTVIMYSTSKEGISISKYFLTREYDGTRLIVEASLIPSNLFYKIATKMFGWASKQIYEDQYQNLKDYVENEVDN